MHRATRLLPEYLKLGEGNFLQIYFPFVVPSKRKSSNIDSEVIEVLRSEKLKNEKPSWSGDSLTDFSQFTDRIDSDRRKAAMSIMEFKFNRKRARLLSKSSEFPSWGAGVIYWMFRDQRIHDNWAVLYAQEMAIKHKVPLHVCFCRKPKYLNSNIRHFDFIFKGLREVEKECEKLDIQFHFMIGCGEDILPGFVENHRFGAVVVDFSPLRLPMSWTDKLSKSLSKDIPLYQVDAHNIVPCWHASDKKEYSARTLRPKINNKLEEFLTEFPPVIKHPFTSSLKPDAVCWEEAGETLEVDRTVPPIEGISSGFTGGMKTLFSFLSRRINIYHDDRDDPTKEARSNVSPWLHFGQISAQRCALSVKKFASQYEKSCETYLKELIVRRELADNFCYYSKNYDNIDGAENWARKTLDDHRLDKRTIVYSKSELENAKTHDNLWNAGQMQLRKEGKMHHFLRLYWGKKILEWTTSPEEALSIAIYLNDKYSLDGRDPNGYVGCMWSICGTHDRAWKERPIFGKIRYMNFEGCKRKFNVNEVISRYC